MFWQAGPLQLWLQRSGENWLVTERRLTDDDCEDGSLLIVDTGPPEELGAKSWTSTQSFDVIRLFPYLPMSPLVVKMLNPTVVPPKRNTVFFLTLPLWIELSLEKSPYSWKLAEIPSQVLSRTWVGNNFEGEAGYALKTSVVSNLEGLNLPPHRVICPFKVINDTEEFLPIDKLCLKPEFLGIYIKDQSLWTNEMELTFKGEGHETNIRYLSRPPAAASKAEVLRPAEKKSEASFFQRTFSALNVFGADASDD